MDVLQASHVKVADEVWIATAQLHRAHPEREDFSIKEIIEQAARARVFEIVRPGLYAHANLHCVANRPPNPGRYRMLVATARGRRRLFRPGDPYDPKREGGKTLPDPSEIPPEYRGLLEWYEKDYAGRPPEKGLEDPILGLRGVGREIWVGEDPDAYVRRIRQGWS